MPSVCSAEDPAQGSVEAGQAFCQLSYISALHEVFTKSCLPMKPDEARDRADATSSSVPHPLFYTVG